MRQDLDSPEETVNASGKKLFLRKPAQPGEIPMRGFNHARRTASVDLITGEVVKSCITASCTSPVLPLQLSDGNASDNTGIKVKLSCSCCQLPARFAR